MSTTTEVSPEVSRMLDHIAGIPEGKTDEIVAAIKNAGFNPPGPAHPFGQWVGGCYYVRDDNGPVHGKQGSWRLVMCVA